jgi:hypothetical protein
MLYPTGFGDVMTNMRTSTISLIFIHIVDLAFDASLCRRGDQSFQTAALVANRVARLPIALIRADCSFEAT